jgi:hypothetical protein
VKNPRIKVMNEIDILALEKFDNVKFSTAFSR